MNIHMRVLATMISTGSPTEAACARTFHSYTTLVEFTKLFIDFKQVLLFFFENYYEKQKNKRHVFIFFRTTFSTTNSER